MQKAIFAAVIAMLTIGCMGQPKPGTDYLDDVMRVVQRDETFGGRHATPLDLATIRSHLVSLTPDAEYGIGDHYTVIKTQALFGQTTYGIYRSAE